MAGQEDFEYNDEFFFDATTRQRAAADFSDIWFALHSEKMAAEFRKNDDETKRLKAEFQLWGFGVVILAVIALSLAAVEPTFLRPATEAGYLHSATSEIVASVGGLAGVASVLMGYFGMGFAGRKLRWLRTRLLCERIRQWRWQHFCAHIPEIVEASADKIRRDEFASRRDLEFSKFVENLKAGQEAALRTILSPAAESPDAVWAQADFKIGLQRIETLHAIESSKPLGNDPASQLIAAYKNARIGAQKRYARYLVRDSGPFTTHPAIQRAWLHKRGVALLLAIFTLHILVLALVLAGIFPFHSPAIVTATMNVSAVILALVALGLRAAEDGLRPSEHLGRLKGYLAEVSSIEEAFDEAATAGAKRDLMIALEKASYKEMVDFLQAGNRSQYVM
jgi:hypothetical protein